MKDKIKVFTLTKKDFEVQTFRSGGKGGQHQNTCDSGVRIIHKESGAVGESRSEKSQYQNKQLAKKHLINSLKFKLWLNRKIFNIDKIEREIEKKVDEDIKKDNLKIEIKVNGKWCEEK